ncbi:MAG TPA: DUF3987 domain-containing protein [Gaiellaceae bacterium]|nr:DUF3987 domain-containing protein [Gaiellaceae bacterium]
MNVHVEKLPEWAVSAKALAAFSAANDAEGARRERAWPCPLGADAYHGVVGDFVRAVEPHTEGDPAAVLIQALVCLGNALGRGPHFMIEDDRHGANLHLAVVGDTSRARKGTSLGRAKRLVLLADPRWGAVNDGEGGLSTAEGLIHAVRDPRGAGSRRDPGADDKRLLAMISEFAETLGKMKREGNTLGATIRNAWDGKTLRTRTKNDPLTATEAHVSIIGHITEADLHGLLSHADIFNGFGNRFLWVVARRSKSLPFGGDLRVEELDDLVADVKRSIIWADEKDRLIEFDAKARAEWAELYDELGSNGGGRFGAMVDRAEPQVRRLALVYTALDRSEVTTRAHLCAALEVWRYCEQSAAYLFADAPSPGVTGRVQEVLRRQGGWVARTALYRALEPTYKRYHLDSALKQLTDAGLVEQRRIRTGGRPKTEYRDTGNEDQ